MKIGRPQICRVSILSKMAFLCLFMPCLLLASSQNSPDPSDEPRRGADWIARTIAVAGLSLTVVSFVTKHLKELREEREKVIELVTEARNLMGRGDGSNWISSDRIKSASERRNIEMARQRIEQALRINKECPVARYYLGLYWLRRNRHAEAINQFRKAIEIDSDYAAAHNAMGAAWRRRGALNKAVSCYQTAISLDSQYPVPYYNMGNVLILQENINGAIQSYGKAIDLDPGYAPPYTGLGRAFCKREDWSSAISSYQDAIRFDPTAIEARVGLGIALAASGDLEQAIEVLEEAESVAGDDPLVHRNKGVVLWKQARYSDAVKAFRKSLRFDPKDVELEHLLSRLTGLGNAVRSN